MDNGLAGARAPLVLDLGGQNVLDGAAPGERGGGGRMAGPAAPEDKFCAVTALGPGRSCFLGMGISEGPGSWAGGSPERAPSSLLGV